MGRKTATTKLLRKQPWFNDLCCAVKKRYGFDFGRGRREEKRFWEDFTFEVIAASENLAAWSEAILCAALENDLDFFGRLGTAIKKGGRYPFDKLEMTIIRNWSYGGKIGVPLKYFSDKAALEVVRMLTGNQSLSMDAYTKRRQRLGLSKGKPTLVREVTVTCSGGFSFEVDERCEKKVGQK